MCYLCKAGLVNPLLRYNDPAPTAGWRATCRTNASYALELAALGRTAPVLLDTLTGLDLRYIMVDVLHAVDLGVGACVIGNILAEILPSFGANQKARLENLNAELQRWYFRTDPSPSVAPFAGDPPPNPLMLCHSTHHHS